MSGEIGFGVEPMVDSSAPYSAIRFTELVNFAADGAPGQHTIIARRIVGSIVATASTSSQEEISIQHLVQDGSSRYVRSQDVTKHGKIIWMDENCLQLPGPNDETIR